MEPKRVLLRREDEMRTLRSTLMAVTTGLVMVLVLSASAHAQTGPPDDPPASPRAGAASQDEPPLGAEAWDADTNAPLAAWACPINHVCFWNQPNGRGRRCIWDVADPDWLNGSIQCSWARENVKSVFNNSGPEGGHDWTGVVYYRQDRFRNRVGCTRNFQKGNLAGTYTVRSHEWTTGHCG
jgi:hypothetical protein